MKISKLQHDKLTELMANISSFSTQYGKIENILIMHNKSVPNTIFVKYDKTIIAKLLNKNPGTRVGISIERCLSIRGQMRATRAPTIIPPQAPYLLAFFE